MALSLLVICFSGVHAETVEEPSEEVCQDQPKCGDGMNGEMNTLGIGKQDDPRNWTPEEGSFGIGKQDDPRGIDIGDDTD